MPYKDDVAMARTIALKRLRNRVRLEASVRSDLLLNEIEKEFLDEFNERVTNGEAYVLDSYDDWLIAKLNERFPLPAHKEDE